MFSTSSFIAIATTLASALAQTNITLSATFEDGSTSALAPLHEGAGFSFLFEYDSATNLQIDYELGIISIPSSVSEDSTFLLQADVDSKEIAPFEFNIVSGHNSSVFWFLDRPTGGESRLNGVVKGEGSLIKFYAGKNATYDPYRYSTDRFFIGGSPYDIDYLTVGGVTDLQEVEIWAKIA
ncbi:CYFA0S25e00254g1_1 [Cyberlindnera fabianii]|uniref:CYFA0S25e00254g1_1 n=1 Tax=Cyberlindnera fabianii TaxID=36022 RepID=A0A061B9P1_CYBFA|nr:hypothetical protein BON22_1044 [Cyberlindnera fabianii]CDR46651.1 CYFA0S25e00254g1_1 [Cyberlindnera fabianii]